MIDKFARCVRCPRRLRYSEREAWPQFLCAPCATAAGVLRLSDVSRLFHLRSRAARLASWWRWTVYLDHAVQWVVLPPVKESSHG